MTAYQYLCGVQKFLPVSRENTNPCKPVSKSEIKRWLQNKTVIINGRRPNWDEQIQFPIDELVFFPNARTRTTMIYETSVDKNESILSE
jgi:hypothetical protein